MTAEPTHFMRRFASAAWRHFARAVAGNLQGVEATALEKARLEARGITEDALQRYAVWRRSTLLAVIVPTLLSAVLATIDTVGNGTAGLSRFGQLLTVVSTLILYALPVSAFAAFLGWSRLNWSHRWLLRGWCLGFLPPFVLALVPVSWWFVSTNIPEEQTAQRLGWDVLDMLRGVYFYCTLMPAVLSLLPGMIRACLRLKSLLPSSIVPGWFLVSGAPFFVLLWLVTLIALNHLAGNPLLVAGVLLWIGAPMIFVLQADLLVRPIAASDCGRLDRLRRLSGVVAMIGLLLLISFVLTKKVFGFHVVGLEEETSLLWLWENSSEDAETIADLFAHATSLVWVGELNLYQLVLEYLSRSLFVMVVFADLLLRINLSVWKYERAFRDMAAAAEYDTTMAAMERQFGPAG